jgi:hypothetical protein
MAKLAGPQLLISCCSQKGGSKYTDEGSGIGVGVAVDAAVGWAVVKLGWSAD